MPSRLIKTTGLSIVATYNPPPVYSVYIPPEKGSSGYSVPDEPIEWVFIDYNTGWKYRYKGILFDTYSDAKNYKVPQHTFNPNQPISISYFYKDNGDIDRTKYYYRDPITGKVVVVYAATGF